MHRGRLGRLFGEHFSQTINTEVLQTSLWVGGTHVAHVLQGGCAGDSVELYRYLLGLMTFWTVERVELDMLKQHVEIHVGHPVGQGFAGPGISTVAGSTYIQLPWPTRESGESKQIDIR